MKRLFLTMWFTLFCIITFSQESELSPACWLRADSIRQGETMWRDVSSHGLHATPQSGAMPDTMALLNFNPCVPMRDGLYFSVRLDSMTSDQADVIVVYETSDSITDNALWQLRIDSARQVGQTTQRILNDNGQIVYDSVNKMKPVINYLAQSWRKAGRGVTGYGSTASEQNGGDATHNVSTLNIGMADSLPLNGRLAEAIYFDHRISDTAVIQWISYLAVKYGVTLEQTDYLDSRKNVIWNYTDYPEYAASIAGIGRDDSTGLYQRQTYFAEGHIIVSIGSVTNTNEENTSIIADGDFLIMGMDSSALQRPVELYTQSGETYEVIGRSMMQATGDVMTYNTFLWLDTNAVQDTVVPVLLIDRSGSGDFLAWETDRVWPAINDSLGCFVYDNIYWDTDLNGRDAFCFAVNLPDEATTPRIATANDTTTLIPLLLDSTNEREESQACLSFAERGGEGGTASNGCPKGGVVKAIVSENHSSSSTYHLFPNPNHGRFTIEIAYPVEQEVTVTVYASDGKKVMVMSGKGQSDYRFEGQMETSGHYLIDIVSDRERKQLKMVVN